MCVFMMNKNTYVTIENIVHIYYGEEFNHYAIQGIDIETRNQSY